MLSNDFLQFISKIENTSIIQLNSFSQPTEAELKFEINLLTNLAGNYGAFIVRFILSNLGVDENRIFEWRLENKFRQYQILNHYFPGCMPDTLALSNILNQNGGEQKARKLFGKGYFLKSTLGDASFVNNNWNKTPLFDKLVRNYPDSTDKEEYVIQKKLSLFREFRIHSFCRDIIPLLTYRIPATQDTNFHQGAENFVSMVLCKLPDQILQGTLIGWDIGITTTGKYYVIESNLTGFHPEYRRGFQTTGYVDNHKSGAIITAWLNNYFKVCYGFYINTIDHIFDNHPFLTAFKYYSSIFNKEYFHAILRKEQHPPVSVLVYITIDSNMLIELINHFHQVDFATNYYVITRPKDFDMVKVLFSKKVQVKVIDETELFTSQQYQVIVRMDIKRREQVCCHHASKKLNDTYIII